MADSNVELISWFGTLNKVCNQLKAGRHQRNSVPRHLVIEKDIHNFLMELQHSSENWHAMKLVVLGNGQIGKTTMLHAMKKLLNQNLPQV